MSSAKIAALAEFSACDISDALLKLEVPGAGFLADIVPVPDPQGLSSPSRPLTKTIAPASTLMFTAQSTPSFPPTNDSSLSIFTSTFSLPSPNIPKGMHWADLTLPGSIVVISQPPGQACAVVGGIMAARMRAKGVKGVAVSGRVRDLGTIAKVVKGERETVGSSQEVQAWSQEVSAQPAAANKGGMPIWSRGTSTIGAGAETKPWAINVPVKVGRVDVHPGDIIMLDPAERGAVCIPAKLIDKVLEILPSMVAADEKVIEHVEDGGLVSEAFRRFRGK